MGRKIFRTKAELGGALVDIRKFVGVEEGEADVGEGAGAQRDVGGAEVGDEVGVGVERFLEGEFLAGVFLDGFAADFEGRRGRGWRVVGDEGGDGFPVRVARGEFGGARGARIREGETAGEGVGIG